MGNNAKTAPSLIIGSIIIAVTLVIFFVGFSAGEKTALHWLSLTFVLIAEVALTAGLVVMPLNQPGSSANLVKMGVLTTLVIYFVAAVVLALLAGSVFADNKNGFITTNIVVIGVAATVIIALQVSASSLTGKEGQDPGSDDVLKNSMIKVFSLKSNPDYQEYTPVLDRLYDEFQYRDQHRSLASIDQNIEADVLELADYLSSAGDKRNGQEVEARTSRIIAKIKERNMRLKQ